MTRAKNDNPDYVFQQDTSTPDAGTTQCPGKSNEPDAALRTGKQPKSSAVTEAKCDDGALAHKCLHEQLGFNDKDKDGNVIGNGYRGN